MFDLKSRLSWIVKLAKQNKKITACIVFVAVFFALFAATLTISSKTIILREVCYATNTNQTTAYKTRQLNVAQFLKEKNIALGKSDYMSLGLDARLQGKNEIVIKRAVKLSLMTKEGEKDFLSSAPNVGEALKSLGLTIGELDEVTPAKETLVKPDMKIKVANVEIIDVSEQREIPYKTITKRDSSISVGKSNVLQNGENGVVNMLYKVTLKDGKQVAKEYLGEQEVKSPVEKKVAVGTKEFSREYSIAPVATVARAGELLTSRGESFRYRAVVNVKATAYDTLPTSNGGSSRTKTGMKLRPGVIAVDPSVIPLGSRVYIESTDDGNTWSYGYAIAADTGGAIRGNKIDLCFTTTEEARRFGVRQAKVYILE